MREQLHLRIVADARVGAFDLDAGLVELHEQPVDRHLQDLGKLGNCYFSHALHPRRLLARFEPVSARLHDELAGLFGAEPLDVRDVVDGLLGQLLTRAHAASREREREIRAHALEQQQIVCRHRLVEASPRSRSPASAARRARGCAAP